jgi:hypothetical protein
MSSLLERLVTLVVNRVTIQATYYNGILGSVSATIVAIEKQ